MKWWHRILKRFRSVLETQKINFAKRSNISLKMRMGFSCLARPVEENINSRNINIHNEYCRELSVKFESILPNRKCRFLVAVHLFHLVCVV
jgi:hypothetical protein